MPTQCPSIKRCVPKRLYYKGPCDGGDAGRRYCYRSNLLLITNDFFLTACVEWPITGQLNGMDSERSFLAL